jgi:hypothetical protein
MPSLFAPVTRLAAAVALTTVTILAAPEPVAAAINPANYTTRSASVLVADDGNGAATAQCPTGQKAVTGGASWIPDGLYSEDSLYLLDAYLRSSVATADGGAWYAAGHNQSGQSLYLSVVVYCLPKSALGTYVTKTREVTVDPGRSGNATLTCKSTQVAINGGAAWHKPGEPPKAGLVGFLSTSRPESSGRAWVVAGQNEGASILMLQVRVSCIPRTSVGGCCGSSTYLTFANVFDMVKRSGTCQGGFALTGGSSWDYDAIGGNFQGFINTDSRGHIQSSTLGPAGLSWYTAGAQSDILLQRANHDTVVICAG